MKIMCAPQKVGVGLEQNLRTIRGRAPRAVGLTEMDLGKTSKTHLVRSVLGKRYKVLVRDIGAHSEEIPVAVKVGPFCRVLHFKLTALSPDVGDKGTGNDRYLAETWFRRFRRTYVVLHTHTNAVVQNHDPKSPDYLAMLNNVRVAPTAAAMQTIEEHAAAAIADPGVTAVWVMGDLNILPTPREKEWEHSPQAMFRRLGMQWENSRVVYLAWSKGVKPRGKVTTIPAHSKTNRADHGWLVGRFRRVKGK